MDRILPYLFLSVAGYLSGSIVYSYFLPKLLFKKDILEISDDGNPGCANVFKYVGIPMGILCLVLDFFKGYVPVFIASHMLSQESLLFALVIASPSAGHAFSPFLRLKGGKAINVSFGSLAGLMPRFLTVWWLVIPFVILSTVFRLNPHSLRVAVSFSTMLVLSFLFDKSAAVTLAVLLLCVSVLYRHLPGYIKGGYKEGQLKFLHFTLWGRQ